VWTGLNPSLVVDNRLCFKKNLLAVQSQLHSFGGATVTTSRHYFIRIDQSQNYFYRSFFSRLILFFFHAQMALSYLASIVMII